MIACLFASLVVICLLALLLRVRRLDPFNCYAMRAFMFPGFRRQRLITWAAGISGTLVLLGLSVFADFAGSPTWQGIMVATSSYCIIGMFRVLARLRDLGFERRNADPMLQALTLMISWPFWRDPA